MARRREERIIISLPVRLWGMDINGKPFTQPATTVDITRMGARLQGVNFRIQHGDIIGVQHGTDKARFRVIWVARQGSRNEGQIGVHCVEVGKYIWGTIKPSNKADSVDPRHYGQDVAPPSALVGSVTRHPGQIDVPAGTAGPQGRRKMARYPCRGGGEVRQPGMKTVVWGSLTDISRTGCYLETLTTLPRHAKCDLSLNVEGVELRAGAEVRVSHPSMGMGLEFVDMDPTDRKKLDDLLYTVSGGRAGSAAELEETSKISSEFVKSITSAAAQLRELETLVASQEEDLDQKLLVEFRNALDHARTTTAAIEQWVDLQQQDRDPFPVLAAIETSRVRMAASLLRELAMDIDANNLHLGSEGIKELYEAVRLLHLRIEQLISDATDSAGATGEEERPVRNNRPTTN